MKKQLFRLACLAVLVLAGLSSSAQAMCCFGGKKKQNQVVPVDQATVNSNINKLLEKSRRQNGLGKRDFRKLQNWMSQLESKEDYHRAMRRLYPNLLILDRSQASSPEQQPAEDDGLELPKSPEAKAERYAVLSKGNKSHVFAEPSARPVLDRQVDSLWLVDEYQLAITRAEISRRTSQ